MHAWSALFFNFISPQGDNDKGKGVGSQSAGAAGGLPAASIPQTTSQVVSVQHHQVSECVKNMLFFSLCARDVLPV